MLAERSAPFQVRAEVRAAIRRERESPQAPALAELCPGRAGELLAPSLSRGPLMTDSPRFSDAPQRLEELTAVLAQMGAVVLSAETIDSTIELVATLAAETIPATTGAGGDPGRRTRQTKHCGLGHTGRTRGCAAVPVRLRALPDRVARPG